jgi:hypothetical protein
MRDLASLAPALLFLAFPLASRAASLQILSSARSITTSAYLTDDVIVSANLAFGPITCTSANQTSTYAISAFHTHGSHNCFAQDNGTAGFGTSYASSTFHVIFRLIESSGYELSGFVQGADLGSTTITFAGPDHLALDSSTDALPIAQTASLRASPNPFSSFVKQIPLRNPYSSSFV